MVRTNIVGRIRIRVSKEGRAWFIVPPTSPVVHALAGRKRGALITLMVDASKCEDRDLDGHSIQFYGTIMALKRSDGGLWFKVWLPKKVTEVIKPIADCASFTLLLEHNIQLLPMRRR